MPRNRSEKVPEVAAQMLKHARVLVEHLHTPGRDCPCSDNGVSTLECEFAGKHHPRFVACYEGARRHHKVKSWGPTWTRYLAYLEQWVEDFSKTRVSG